MTSLLERTISVIAPHGCIRCSKESNVLCDSCRFELFAEGPELCFLCNNPTADSRVCRPCRASTKLGHVWTAATYEGDVKRLIRAYKFERVRAAYQPLAAAIIDRLPYLEGIVVAYIPTASRRVRQRGYDHARLLAQEVARLQGWECQPLLLRRHDARQVGATKQQRKQQAQLAFELKSNVMLEGRHILLIDDVTTSGATLVAAADILSSAGAIRVDAAVVAKHTLEQP